METVLAWLLAISFGGAFFGTTKADILDKGPYETYKLGYFTTAVGSDLFDFAFERTAEQVCPYGYKVLDKTNRPNQPGNSRTLWLIECVEKPK